MTGTTGHRTAIWVAVIGAVGVIVAAVVGNLDFGNSDHDEGVQQKTTGEAGTHEGVDGTRVASDGVSERAEAPSTDIDSPTPLPSGAISGIGIGQEVSYYYTFVGGPGEIRVVVDGKNEFAPIAHAVRVTISDLDANPIVSVGLGNTTISKREVASARVLGRKRLIMRVLLSRHTLEYKIRVEGAVEV